MLRAHAGSVGVVPSPMDGCASYSACNKFTDGFVPMAKARSPMDALSERIFRSASHENLTILRNASYGAAAVCIATLVSLTQVGAKSLALSVSVYASAMALPLWLLIGGVIEHYITIGPTSYPHFEVTLKRFDSLLVSQVAMWATVASIGGVIYFLIPAAFWLFAASGTLAMVHQFLFNRRFAAWLASSQDASADPASRDV